MFFHTVVVTIEAGEVTARDLQADAMARQKNIRCGPQVEPKLVDHPWLKQFSLRE
jgi:hypothetical protein